MSQKQQKQKKCRITEEELFNRFADADINGNGKLSANEVTTLLQNLGYEDTYKGTIRKICRNLNKEKKLKQQLAQKNTQKDTQNMPSTSQPNDKNQTLSNKDSEESQEESRIRKQSQNKQQQQEAGISFEQFKKYFEILEKPVGKVLYTMSLSRSIQVAEFCKDITVKNMFHKDKGQKLKINFLIGDQKPSYNSFIDLRLQKEPKSKKNEEIYFIELEITADSEENASKAVSFLKGLCDMLLQMITSENEGLADLQQIILIEQKTQGKVGKLRISTTDDDVKKFINEYSGTLDEVLDTEITFVIKVLYQFNFNLSDLKNSPNSMMEDLFVKDANIKIQYIGSQFLDAVKQIAVSKNVFELLRVDTDPLVLSLMGFLSLEKGNIFLKFKNLQRSTISREFTEQILQMCSKLKEMQSESFDLKSLSQLVQAPIILRVQIQDIKLELNINVKDILKLPFMTQGEGNGGYDSD